MSKNNKCLEKLLLEKIDSGKDLNVSDLTLLVTTFSHTAHTRGVAGGCEDITTVAKLSNRYFYLDWELGSDEYGGDITRTFFEQPVEVHLEIRTEKHERWVDSHGQVLL